MATTQEQVADAQRSLEQQRQAVESQRQQIIERQRQVEQQRQSLNKSRQQLQSQRVVRTASRTERKKFAQRVKQEGDKVSRAEGEVSQFFKEVDIASQTLEAEKERLAGLKKRAPAIEKAKKEIERKLRAGEGYRLAGEADKEYKKILEENPQIVKAISKADYDAGFAENRKKRLTGEVGLDMSSVELSKLSPVKVNEIIAKAKIEATGKEKEKMNLLGGATPTKTETSNIFISPTTGVSKISSSTLIMEPPKIKDTKITPYPFRYTFDKTSQGVPDVSMSTLAMRPPTLDEQSKLNEAQYKGDLYAAAITGVPAQIAFGFISTPATSKESKEVFSNFADIGKQYKMFKGSFDYKRDSREAQRVSDRLENINTRFEASKKYRERNLIDLSEGNIKDNVWIGSQDELNKYNQEVNKYNKESKVYEAKFDVLSSDKAYQNVISSTRKDFFQRTADSKLSPTQKGAIAGTLGFIELGSLLLPPVRVVRGTDMFFSGAIDIVRATDKKETIMAATELGFGALLVSGGLGKSSKSSLFSNVLGKGTTGKVVRTSLNWGLPAGFSGLYGASIAKRTGSLSVGIGAGIGGFVGLKSPELYRGGKYVLKKVGAGSKVVLNKIAFTERKLYNDKRGQLFPQQTKPAESEYAYYDPIKKKWIKKGKLTLDEIQKIEEVYKYKKVGKNKIETTKTEKVEFIRREMNKLIQGGDREKIISYKKLLESIYSKEEAKALLTEYYAQEGYSIYPSTAKIDTPAELPLMVGGSGLKFIPYAGEGTYERTGEVGFLNLKADTKQDQLLLSLNNQKTNQLSLLDTKLKSNQQSKLLSGSVASQLSLGKTKQQEKQQSSLKSKLVSLLASAPQSVSKSASVSKQQPKLFQSPSSRSRPGLQPKLKPKPKKPILNIFGLPPPSSNSVSKLRKKLKELKSVDIKIGLGTIKKDGTKSKEFILEKNVAPRRALKKATKFVDDNLSASFKLIPNKRPPKRKDISFGEANNLLNKFTPSKTNPLFLKEKLKFRGDTFGEKSQLKLRRSITRKKKSSKKRRKK